MGSLCVLIIIINMIDTSGGSRGAYIRTLEIGSCGGL